jgi:ABC-type nitrate/sulfonate/bicarbonate transport system ATPase subunit
VQAPSSIAQLKVESVGKAFPSGKGGGSLGADGDGVQVLAGVDMEVGAGELVSIVGPSGCGKSTLLNIVAGLDPPSSGRILLEGRERHELLGSVGYMPQQDLLMPWRTVLDNTILGLEMAGVGRREARDRARAQIARFGLAGFEDAWPSQISGGMRQRAALLRTFLPGNDLVLLDEPFVALDALTRQAMQQWLLDIWQEQGSTILFVTHDVEEALFLSDRVYVMSGRPGRMELSLEVDMARPRRLEQTTLDPHFIEMKRRLMEPLRAAAERLEGDLQ